MTSGMSSEPPTGSPVPQWMPLPKTIAAATLGRRCLARPRISGSL